jgi:outer membrane receptor for ferrienterochelin and colicins
MRPAEFPNPSAAAGQNHRQHKQHHGLKPEWSTPREAWLRAMPAGILAGVMAGSLAGAWPVAAGAEDAEVVLPEVLVTTGTRTPQEIGTAPAPVQLIDQADIAISGAPTLRGILDRAPNLYVSPSGGTLQIRGLGGSDTLYLLDGRRVNGELSNSFELERIAAGSIDRIEVVRGPASMLYGSDALGGVVNIITRPPEAGREIGLDVQYGANDAGEGARWVVGLDLRGGSEQLQGSLYASALRRDPYAETEIADVTVPHRGVQIPPSRHPNPRLRRSLPERYSADVDYRDEADVDNVGGSLLWTLLPGLEVQLDAAYLQETRDGSFISSRYPSAYLANGRPIQAANIPATQHDDNDRLDTAASLRWSPLASLDLGYRLSWSRYRKDRAVYAVDYAALGYASAADSVTSVNRSTLEQLIHELTSVWRPAPGQILVGGLEYRREEVDSTAYDADPRTFSSAFLQHEWQVLDPLNLVYGARLDDDSVGGSQPSFQAGAVWTLAPLARLRANWAQGFKAPDDRSLYVNQVNPQGFPMLGAEVIAPNQGKTTAHSLDPETSETLEIGIAGEHNWSYAITLFDTRIEDRIERVREGTDLLPYNSFRNIGEAHIRGLEAEGSVPLGARLRASASFTHFSAENEDTGERLLNTPETLANVAIDYTPAADWLLQVMVRHIGEQDYLGTTGVETADAYTPVSLRASWTPSAQPGFELYAGIDNLLDAEVDTALGSDPGPYGLLGVRYRF